MINWQQEVADKLSARAEKAEARVAELEAALVWFADEGHYEGTYRHGAGFVDAVGLTQARAALLGMSPDDGDAVGVAWASRSGPSVRVAETSKTPEIHMDGRRSEDMTSTSELTPEEIAIAGGLDKLKVDANGLGFVPTSWLRGWRERGQKKDHLECAGCGVWCPGATLPTQWTDVGGRHYCYECSEKRLRGQAPSEVPPQPEWRRIVRKSLERVDDQVKAAERPNDVPPDAVARERERCARHCEVLAHFMETGAGPLNAPGARLRQAAQSIREGEETSLWSPEYQNEPNPEYTIPTPTCGHGAQAWMIACEECGAVPDGVQVPAPPAQDLNEASPDAVDLCTLDLSERWTEDLSDEELNIYLANASPSSLRRLARDRDILRAHLASAREREAAQRVDKASSVKGETISEVIEACVKALDVQAYDYNQHGKQAQEAEMQWAANVVRAVGRRLMKAHVDAKPNEVRPDYPEGVLKSLDSYNAAADRPGALVLMVDEKRDAPSVSADQPGYASVPLPSVTVSSNTFAPSSVAVAPDHVGASVVPPNAPRASDARVVFGVCTECKRGMAIAPHAETCSLYPPRVTSEDWRTVAEMAVTAMRAGANVAEIRARFGLDEQCVDKVPAVKCAAHDCAECARQAYAIESATAAARPDYPEGVLKSLDSYNAAADRGDGDAMVRHAMNLADLLTGELRPAPRSDSAQHGEMLSPLEPGKPFPPPVPLDRGALINEHAAACMRLVELEAALPEVEKLARKTPRKDMPAQRQHVEVAKARIEPLKKEISALRDRCTVLHLQLDELGAYGPRSETADRK